MMPNLKRVEVGMRLGPSALEVFAAYEAGINVDVGQGHRTKLFKVEIQYRAVDGIEV